jgi:hypothetical protein
MLPAQCEEATQVDSVNGNKKIQAFGNWSPRVSVTRDLFGDGRTQVHGNVSYYYDTKITLANSLGGLNDVARLRWGPNASSGACTGDSCWTDANRDGVVQLNELTGTPSVSSDRFQNGVFVPVGNIVDPSAKIGRTREAVVGMQHELISNLAIGVDFIYRKYDRGTTTYTIGYTPGPGFDALRALYLPATYTDPVTGLSANYYYVCNGCSRPSGVGSTTLTDPDYRIYRGVDLTLNKRFSNRWQAAVALTLQDNPSFFPYGSAAYIDPTGFEYNNGVSTISKYVFKAQGSYALPWNVNVSANFNWNQGDTRTLSINGPGRVPGGTTGSITRNTLTQASVDTFHFEDAKLLDMGIQKVFPFRGGRNRLKLMLDGFNLFNTNEIIDYVSDNQSVAGFTQPSAIVPPRVFRFGASIAF